ncbi:MAG TPA: hypothetical protein VN578_10660 [Candidatus Binatia bacterium]|nr:hypothetical protein [Candidatus Binatia bacterium]
MLKLILVAILVALLFVGGLAVALFHFWGWKGLVAFPFLLIVLIWVSKVLLGKLFKGLALRLFSMKSSALRGASMTVHSVTPVPEPVGEDSADENEEEGDEDEEVEDEEPREEDGNEEEEEDEDEEKEEEEEERRQYYAVDLTVTPSDKCQGRFWEPGEFILASEKVKGLEDLEEKEVGSVNEVLVWNGSEFGPDEEGKYPGSQRLKVTFGVKPGSTKAWLQYYNETLGPLELPRWELGAVERSKGA